MRANALLHAVLLAVATHAVVAGSSAQEASPAPVSATFPVTIAVDASRSVAPLPPLWRFFGADEPNYAYLPDGQRLIGELGSLRRGDVYFRAHNLLTTGDGTPGLKWGSTNAYTEDAGGRPIYDWTIVDRIFDTYLKNGVRPYVEIGFMPKALSRKPEPYQFTWTPTAKYNDIFLGWTQPPTDVRRWGALVHAWAAHAVERYGAAEVARWYWEVWNEPNIGYWSGTPQEFLELHDYAVDGVRRALGTARVGGPDVAGDGGDFTRAFFDHALHGTNFATGARGTPLDFVSFHAKGKPTFVDGHVQMGIAAQLTTIDTGFNRIAAIPELRRTPIVIGESDPDGCAACQGPQLAYRNSTVYASYTAEALARTLSLAARHGVNIEGALTWAFEFEGAPLFAGFRALATGGIDLPVLNVFRLLAKMGGTQVMAESDGAVSLDAITREGVRDRPDVSALASRDARRLTVLVWHYHDADVPGPVADVSVSLSGLPATVRRARISQFVIDASHANAFTAWQQMGAPKVLSPVQRAALVKAAAVKPLPGAPTVAIAGGRALVHAALPRHSVGLIVIEW